MNGLSLLLIRVVLAIVVLVACMAPGLRYERVGIAPCGVGLPNWCVIAN